MTGIRMLRSELYDDLRCGRHILLYGPRGGGKSTLLADLDRRFAAARIPCARSISTSCLDDITAAFSRAYPEVDAARLTRRAARGRLWLAADRRGGVLLLDHVTRVGTAMTGALRRLRGGIAGVLFAVDVDVERERLRMRSWGLTTLSWRMPSTSAVRLRTLLRSRCTEAGVPLLDPAVERRILSAARGRPGWILRCADLLTLSRYWRGGEPVIPLLCADAEIGLRLEEPPDHAAAESRRNGHTRRIECPDPVSSSGPKPERHA